MGTITWFKTLRLEPPNAPKARARHVNLTTAPRQIDPKSIERTPRESGSTIIVLKYSNVEHKCHKPQNWRFHSHELAINSRGCLRCHIPVTPQMADAGLTNTKVVDTNTHVWLFCTIVDGRALVFLFSPLLFSSLLLAHAVTVITQCCCLHSWFIGHFATRMVLMETLANESLGTSVVTFET